MGIFDIFKSKAKRKEAEKYRIGMEKTRKGVFSRLKKILGSYNEITEELFDELEEVFVMADIGVDTVVEFIDELKNDPRVRGLTSAAELQPIIVDKMFDIYLKGEIVNSNLNFNPNGLSVFLFVGVNGTGKTTTIAKIAHKLKSEGKKVLLAAGDTFRAGAIDQLKIWGERVGCEVVTKPEGSDPSSVIFDAIKKAKADNYDCVLCDTAGRLQTKVNLMNELAKIKRVISREVPDAPHDTLLVIDATTGQNGLSQAKAFIEATDVTGIVLTKLDGTAKGGIVLAIRHIYNIPIKFVGLGEKLTDLEYFDIEKYIYGLFAEMIDDEE
ncbi:MAG: signal recognition particle-docking protein FtsY [Acholeplasmataceae bacterium]|nr:signal recognition particle-docking protein FtsY [Acholeplasmataceae bacterium]HPT89100.1 signal recognition particle-docking protein FtsY [Bacilli bacterium]HQA20009.1 signal recognition particle-docking protein FtsY [Bacilli bacterium]